MELRDRLVTTGLPFDVWTRVFGLERPMGILLGRLTRPVHIPQMNGNSLDSLPTAGPGF